MLLHLFLALLKMNGGLTEYLLFETDCLLTTSDRRFNYQGKPGIA